ncbi:cyclin-related 2 [Lichtheimia corymbifera JMRC:FSU:9682]|uniref:Cyclin-related 2 n=1 Tax=Lichtheimia corymbifera JMRC:FSU:9682 TaxID=1263082 RepID=A0A068RVI4_9FUNG|nr:cyclin-related 2 [Lichtheimia corymbifera JMRC:FSU:9682]
MYPHYHHQPVDATTNAVPGSLYQQPRHVGQQYHHPIAHHPSVPTQAPTPTRHAVYQPPPQPTAPPEPLPSASDVQHTLGLNLPQMAEFASSMVYLMWHARRPSVMALHDASKSAGGPNTAEQDAQSRETAHIANATSSAFKKFSRQILHATQLSESVVMLSLKYIAMLLQRNPNIQGAEGSEYRLFTVALMLANKFLDDNTFTNKTWSDVSGMKVTDLNIMELEFLDVLHFGLFVKKDEFERWKVALVNFKNQLHSVYQAQEQQQRQKMIEASLKSVGLSMLQPQEQGWPATSHDMARQSTPTQQQQQQQPQPQTSMQQQYHQQYLYLLSKAQQPQFPTQPINQPLARVPLRIPAQPVYMNAPTYSSSSHIAPQPQQTAPVQAQQQQQQPPPPPQSNVYDAPMVVSSTPATANIPPPASRHHYPQQQPPPSQIDTQYSTQYASRPQQQPPSASMSKPATRPVYDTFGRPSDPVSADSMYPGTYASLQTTPAYTTAAAYSHPTSAAVVQPPPPSTQPVVNNAVLRASSTPIQGGHDYTMSSGGNGGNLQPPQAAAPSNTSRYYYATPSATPTSTHADNGQGSGYAGYGNGVSVPRPVRSYYLESPAAQPQQHPQIATPATANVDYHAYAMSSAPPPPQQQQQQAMVSAPDPYAAAQRPPNMMRTPTSATTATGYQYPPPTAAAAPPPNTAGYGKSYPSRQQQHLSSVPHPHQQQHQPPPPSSTPAAAAASEEYNISGPVPEDPLTAAESYRTHRR